MLHKCKEGYHNSSRGEGFCDGVMCHARTDGTSCDYERRFRSGCFMQCWGLVVVAWGVFWALAGLANYVG